jgi:hypothetical protein
VRAFREGVQRRQVAGDGRYAGNDEQRCRPRGQVGRDLGDCLGGGCCRRQHTAGLPRRWVGALLDVQQQHVSGDGVPQRAQRIGDVSSEDHRVVGTGAHEPGDVRPGRLDRYSLVHVGDHGRQCRCAGRVVEVDVASGASLAERHSPVAAHDR